MENKINIAELLKDCPKGMELDCTMFDDVTFERFDVGQNRCYFKAGPADTFWTTCYGTINGSPFGKCVIFPKGKTTWEGFQRPFKDGDVLSYQFSGFENRSIYIYMYHPRMNTTYYVAVSGDIDSEFMINDKEGHALNGYNDTVRFASEEEKEKLFQAIKANGYKWNEETKTLEKLFEPKFKVGDIVQDKDNYKVRIFNVNIEDKCYGYESLAVNGIGGISSDRQDDWELVPNKFDITTLKPFESRVLVRHNKDNKWCGSFFSHIDEDFHSHCYKFVTTAGKSYPYCIPYEDNEHLLGTTNDCDEYYKTWE